MNRTLLLLSLLGILLIGMPRPAAAETGFVYRGCLRDDDDSVPTAESYRAEFRLWDSASGGVRPLWGRTRLIVPDATGQFAVHLSDEGEPLDNTRYGTLGELYADSENVSHCYLGVTILTDDGTPPAEIAPRQEILPVPLTAFADTATSAIGDFTVPDRLVAASVEANGKLQAGDVTVQQTTTIQNDFNLERDARFEQRLRVEGNVRGDGILSIGRAGGTFEGLGTLPKGAVLPFTGDTIPSGWALCDGQEGRPDLRDRFVKGTTSSAQFGQTGGAEKVALTLSNLPKHSHEFQYILAESRTLGFGWLVKDSDGIWAKDGSYADTTTAWGRDNPEPHDNLPPFYAVRYIIKTR